MLGHRARCPLCHPHPNILLWEDFKRDLCKWTQGHSLQPVPGTGAAFPASALSCVGNSANPALPGASPAPPWHCPPAGDVTCLVPEQTNPLGAASTAQAGAAPWKLEILTSRSRNCCCVGLVKVLSLLAQLSSPALAFQSVCRDGFIAALHLFPIFSRSPLLRGKKNPKGRSVNAFIQFPCFSGFLCRVNM